MIFVPLFGKIGEESTAHSNTTQTKREDKCTCLCTLQNSSNVPTCRELGLECTPQQHTRCAQGKGKAPHARFLLSVAKNKESATQRISSMGHACIKTTHLFFGVAKKREHTTQRVNSMCHECINTTCLLLGVAKNKESTTQRIRSMCHNALRQRAYTWASISTRSRKPNEKIVYICRRVCIKTTRNQGNHGNPTINSICHECTKTTRLLLGVAKYKEFTTQQFNSMGHECIKTTRLPLGVAKCKESKTQ